MKKQILFTSLMIVVIALAIACTQQPQTNVGTNTSAPAATPAVPAELRAAFDAITANDIMQHTKVLSADEYEGRGPGTKGEELQSSI